jgi:hypothetical protein
MRFDTWTITWRDKIGGRGVHWIRLDQDGDTWNALVKVVMKLLVPWNAGRFSSGSRIGGVSSYAQLKRTSSSRPGTWLHRPQFRKHWPAVSGSRIGHVSSYAQLKRASSARPGTWLHRPQFRKHWPAVTN